MRRYVNVECRKVNLLDPVAKPFSIRVRITEKGIKTLLDILREEGLVIIENYQIERRF